MNCGREKVMLTNTMIYLRTNRCDGHYFNEQGGSEKAKDKTIHMEAMTHQHTFGALCNVSIHRRKQHDRHVINMCGIPTIVNTIISQKIISEWILVVFCHHNIYPITTSSLHVHCGECTISRSVKPKYAQRIGTGRHTYMKGHSKRG